MKPFDVEQAKAEIRERAKALVDVNREEIDRVVEGAIKRLEAEAGAFKDLKSETLGTLFRDSSLVLVDEIDLRREERSKDLRFYGSGGIRLIFQGFGERTFAQRREDTTIPNVRHRLLLFLVPVEE